MPYAEVIGDPIAQSKSPIIHRYWLERLGIAGDYVRTHVLPAEVATFLQNRCLESEWRGCNVTIPHKERVIPLLQRLDPGAAAIGAVNCVVPEDGRLSGYNTDIDGVAAALDSAPLENSKVAVIGAGGGARAVLAYLARRSVARVEVIARNPERAELVRALAPQAEFSVASLDAAGSAIRGAAAVINASSLGMAGADPMPAPLVDSIRQNSTGVTIFDLVTTPAETPFLSAGRAGGGRPVDGLTMLVGQAARAFELFFGVPAPAPDKRLRDLLASDSRNSA